jgi:hypothetical protein
MIDFSVSTFNWVFSGDQMSFTWERKLFQLCICARQTKLYSTKYKIFVKVLSFSKNILNTEIHRSSTLQKMFFQVQTVSAFAYFF